jgi:hypothetical protein
MRQVRFQLTALAALVFGTAMGILRGQAVFHCEQPCGQILDQFYECGHNDDDGDTGVGCSCDGTTTCLSNVCILDTLNTSTCRGVFGTGTNNCGNRQDPSDWFAEQTYSMSHWCAFTTNHWTLHTQIYWGCGTSCNCLAVCKNCLVSQCDFIPPLHHSLRTPGYNCGNCP